MEPNRSKFWRILTNFLPILISFFALFLANTTLDFTPKTDIAVNFFIEDNMGDLSLDDQTKLVGNILLRRQENDDDLHIFDKDEEKISYKLDMILDYLSKDEKYSQLGVEGILIMLLLLVFLILAVQIAMLYYNEYKQSQSSKNNQ